MADRSKALTAMELAKRMRVPEEDPNYVNDPNRAMLAPLMIYGGALGRLGGATRAGEAAAPLAAKSANPVTFSNIRNFTPYEQALANKAGISRSAYGSGKGALSSEEMALIRESYPEFAAELEASLGNTASNVSQSARNVFSEVPAYLSSARDVVMRRLGLQTPAARQASARLMEPGAAEAAMVEGSAAPMAPRVAAATTLAGSLPLLPTNARPMPSSAGMDRIEDPDFYRSVGATTFPRNEALDRSENVPFSALSNNYLDRNAPSELDAYPHQVQGPQQPPVVAAAKRAIPMPPSRELQAQARAEQPSSGILSGLFNRPATTKQLFQQSQDNPDDAGAWMRAERQYAATHKDNPNFDVTKLDESGMNRGGTVGGKPDKDAALHKALEIIHHMIRSR